MLQTNEERVHLAESFAKRVHAETGCTYDGEAFDKHLNHVHDIFVLYAGLIEDQLASDSEANAAINRDLFGEPSILAGAHVFEAGDIALLLADVECAVWLHDVMEDCRVSYSQLKREFGTHVADIVYALTNELGKNRCEMAERTYPKIRNEGALAVFVKLCDRIANTEASCLVSEGSYLDMYRKEYGKFRNFLYREGEWEEMWSYLDQITEGKISPRRSNG
jgi:(p)ppGpp synthase/HD superfamily hydrolase